MGRLGRTLAAAAVALTIAVPGTAAAQPPSGGPLTGLPDEFQPAARAVAEELGLSYDELTTASDDELEATLCAEVDGASPEQIAARADDALQADNVGHLTAAERERLQSRLPDVISELESRYCATAATTTADGDGDSRDGDADGSAGDDEGGTDDDADQTTDDADGSTDGDDDRADDAGAGTTNDDGIPLPTRVDTGAGGTTGTGNAAPMAFGALFATLFGMVGIGLTRRRAD